MARAARATKNETTARRAITPTTTTPLATARGIVPATIRMLMLLLAASSSPPLVAVRAFLQAGRYPPVHARAAGAAAAATASAFLPTSTTPNRRQGDQRPSPVVRPATYASVSTTSVSAATTQVDDGALATEDGTTGAGEGTSSSKVKAVPVHYSMDDIVSLCKRRGIIFPSSEIYNGYAGFYDYGPLGCEIKRNVKDLWWKEFVTGREDVVGVDSSIIHNPATWKSSGHLDGFSDPMVDCKETKLRFRADQLYFAPVVVNGERLGYVCVQESDDVTMIQEAKRQAKAVLKGTSIRKGEEKVDHEPFEFRELIQANEEELAQIPSPASGKPTLTPPRDFNLMFQTYVGAMTDATSVAYLRPETAQGIFLNFKNVQTTSRMKIPFGIAQIGKAFRNEITPRNFIFRSREFEQMEIEYFIEPGDDVWQGYHEMWLQESRRFLVETIGLREDLLGWDVHEGDGLAHYARACTDITFQFPFGTQELMGIAARGDYDLRQHSDGSGKSLEYFDEQTKERYMPHCIEPSLGVDRLMLALICSAYAEDEVGGEKRSLLKFNPRVAPIKISVLPLVKNKPQLVEVARGLFDKLRKRWNCQWDAAGAIGRRYRRADEVGTPFCVTVDFDTIEKDNTVTIRDRDTTEQVRIPMDEVVPYLTKAIEGY